MFECVLEKECKYRVWNDLYQLTECLSKCPSNLPFYYDYGEYVECTNKCREEMYYDAQNGMYKCNDQCSLFNGKYCVDACQSGMFYVNAGRR